LETIVILLVAGLMIAGVAGTVLPFVPGTPLVFAGALLFAWHTDFTRIGWPTLVVLLALTIFSYVVEFLASIVGARKYGGRSSGMWGAFLGGVIGLMVGGIFGLIIGPLVGAFAFEMIRGRSAREAFQVAYGTLIGFLGGILGKVVISIAMIAVFLIALIR
jgi:uncharacterized protein